MKNSILGPKDDLSDSLCDPGDLNKTDISTNNIRASSNTIQGLDPMDLTEENDEALPVYSPSPVPKRILSVISFPSPPNSPNFHVSTPSNDSPSVPPSSLCNVAGASSPSQNAKPRNTSAQLESAIEEDPPCFSEVAKAANILQDITEDMVRTPYKSFSRKAYKNKLQASLHSQKDPIEGWVSGF